MRFQPFSSMMMMLLAALVLSVVFGQSSAHAQNPPRIQHPITSEDPAKADEDQARLDQEKEMAKKANLERQAQLKRDSDKLFQLATELKEYVDKTNENILSLNVIKKSDEIEKLAHSVKEKMKAGY